MRRRLGPILSSDLRHPPQIPPSFHAPGERAPLKAGAVQSRWYSGLVRTISVGCHRTRDDW